jgi:hypothetical protein
LFNAQCFFVKKTSGKEEMNRFVGPKGGMLEALNPLAQMGAMVVGERVAQPANLLSIS